jgi:hypothetical protein
LISFHENRRNRFRSVSSVFSKPVAKFKKLKKFKIKNSKKTRDDFKIFGPRVRNFKVTEATKSGEAETEGKPEKKRKWLIPDKGQP